MPKVMHISNKTKRLILENALEMYAREQFLKKANEAYVNLKKDDMAWNHLKAEMQESDATTIDGLND